MKMNGHSIFNSSDHPPTPVAADLPPSGPVVEMIGVTKRYQDQVALDDFSLTIPRGTGAGV